MALRDANVIIIETGRTKVRAGLGLHELLKTPSIEIPARVAVRKAPTVTATTGYEAGRSALDDDEPFASTSRATSILPTTSNPAPSTLREYLVGSQIDEALAAGYELEISWPFAGGDVADWTQAEAIWKYILFNQLERRRVQNESPVLLSTFAGLSRNTYERICQIFFERFNVAAFGLLELPMAQIYSSNTLSGVVVDIGDDITDVTPIYEGFILHPARGTLPLGLNHCFNYLAHLFKANHSLIQTLSPPTNPLDQETLHGKLVQLVKQLWVEGKIKIPSDGETAVPEDEGVTDIAAVVVAGKEKAVIESGMKKKQNAKASAAEQQRAREIEAMDLITIQFQGKNVTVGKERHRLCEPLFDPHLLAGVPGVEGDVLQGEKIQSLQEYVGHVVSQTELDYRPYIWHGLFVTGDITRYVKGVGVALQSRLAPFMSNPELSTDVQPKAVQVVNVPEYYAEYRETGNGYAAFLGTSITAKIIFNDSAARSYVSKSDYTAKGPHAVIEMTPALL